jgi:hypothetical protein
MAKGPFFLIVLLGGVCAAQAQESASSSPTTHAGDAEVALSHRPPATLAAGQAVELTVPMNTALQVVLNQEVRVKKVGQPITGRIAEPVYAFDKLVVPAGAEVAGRITKIEAVSGGKRTVAALDANFTPVHKVDVEFDEIVLPDGKRIPIRTIVTPGSGRPVQFVTAPDSARDKKESPDAATKAVAEAKHEAQQEWNAALKEAKEPGKVHRLEHFAVAELPAHPQYIEPGTAYFAELQAPLEFGTETLTPDMAASIGATPPAGSVVEARLVTPLSSATAHPGDAVEAMISRPLFEGNRLIVPQGSILRGAVIQARPAHHPARNGELRIVFHELRLAEGIDQKVEANLSGVEAEKAEHVKLDTEGGARATPPGTRFVTTGLEVGLGAFSAIGDSGGGDIVHEEAGGLGGDNLVGIAMAVAIHSQPFGMAMGAFGAGRSIYGNFVARGHDVVFPKDTAMMITVATRPPAPGTAKQPTTEMTKE